MKKIIMSLIVLAMVASLFSGCQKVVTPIEPEVTPPLNATTVAFDKAGSYTVPTGTSIVEIRASEVELKDCTVDKVVIGKEVGDGEVILNNVYAGELEIYGGGENSIHVNGTSLFSQVKMARAEGTVRLVVSKSATIETLTVAEGSKNIVLTGSFKDVSLQSTKIGVSAIGADIENLNIEARGVIFIGDKDTVVSVAEIKGAGVTLENKGKTDTVLISANDTSIQVKGATLSVEESVSGTTANGKAVDGGSTNNITDGGVVVPPLNVPETSLPTESVWDGVGVDVDWYLKDTTKSSYDIYKAEELAGLAKLVNSGYVLNDITVAKVSFENVVINLRVNINLDSHLWTPIGSADSNFKGTFNGSNNTISNLKIEGGDSLATIGLFSIIENATIKNLKLNNVDIKSRSPSCNTVGAVAGTALGNVTISSVVVSGQIASYEYSDEQNNPTSGIARNNYTFVAGIVGTVKPLVDTQVTINNCTNSATLYSNKSLKIEIGGIFAWNGAKITVDSCINNGDITAMSVSPEGSGFGGIAGFANGTDAFVATIKNCTNNGNIVGLKQEKGSRNLGGIAGSHFDGAKLSPIVIENCVNNGRIVGESYIGGISGYGNENTYVSITNCTNNGSVEAMNTVGGIAGTIIGDIKNSINNASIMAEADSKNVGGIIGGYVAGGTIKAENFSEPVKTAGFVIENCENNGTSNANNFGDIIGHFSSSIMPVTIKLLTSSGSSNLATIGSLENKIGKLIIDGGTLFGNIGVNSNHGVFSIELIGGATWILNKDSLFAKNETVTIGEGSTLIINEGATLKNNGTIIKNGNIINNNIVEGRGVLNSVVEVDSASKLVEELEKDNSFVTLKLTANITLENYGDNVSSGNKNKRYITIKETSIIGLDLNGFNIVFSSENKSTVDSVEYYCNGDSLINQGNLTVFDTKSGTKGIISNVGKSLYDYVGVIRNKGKMVVYDVGLSSTITALIRNQNDAGKPLPMLIIESGNLSVTGTSSGGYTNGKVAINNRGNLIVNGGTISTGNGDGTLKKVAIFSGSPNATTIINGGTIKAIDYSADFEHESGKILINAGTFKNNPTSYLSFESQIEMVNSLYVVSKITNKVNVDSFEKLKEEAEKESLGGVVINITNDIVIANDAKIKILENNSVIVNKGTKLTVEGTLENAGKILNNGEFEFSGGSKVSGSVERIYGNALKHSVYSQRAPSEDFVVDSAEALTWLSYLYNNSETGFSNIIINSDIDMTDWAYSPLGNVKRPFSGKIATQEGAVRTISNLKISNPLYSGLIGLANDVEIKDVAIENSEFETSSGRMGAFIAQVTGNARLENLVVGKNTCLNATTSYYGGGIIGQISSASGDKVDYINCSFNGKLSSSFNVGAVFGTALGSQATITIDSCSANNATVKAKGATVGLIGGFSTGKDNGTVNIIDFKNVGSIVTDTVTNGGVVVKKALGGNAFNVVNYSVKTQECFETMFELSDSVTLVENLELTSNLTIKTEKTLILAEGVTLTIKDAVTLTNNGKIDGTGTIIKIGNIDGSGTIGDGVVQETT